MALEIHGNRFQKSNELIWRKMKEVHIEDGITTMEMHIQFESPCKELEQMVGWGKAKFDENVLSKHMSVTGYLRNVRLGQIKEILIKNKRFVSFTVYFTLITDILSTIFNSIT